MLEDEITPIGHWIADLVKPDICWWCGLPYRFGSKGFNGRIVHHIEFRSHVCKVRRDYPCNLFLAHNDCHQGVLHACDKAAVLARKLLHDPEHFDLDQWCRLADDRAAEKVTLREVVRYFEVKRC